MLKRRIERQLRDLGYSRKQALTMLSRGRRWLWLAMISISGWLWLTR